MSGTSGAVAPFSVEAWGPDIAGVLDDDIDMLRDVLHAVVHEGAGVSFVVPFSREDARTFWTDNVLPGVRAGTRRVVVARVAGRIVGTVQLDLAVPPNQLHRGEILKLLVHPDARRRGIARALMSEIEAVARAEGRTLLTLDTWTGGSAERLYRSMGYVAAGVIPRYARGSVTPALEGTTIMYKELDPSDLGDGRLAREMASAALPEGLLRPIGVIRSELALRNDAPKQGDEGAPDAWLDVQPWAVEALHGLAAGDQVIVITWFHQARRDVLQVHPRSDPRNPLAGVFATRSPDRPNPLGLHPVVVRAVERSRLRIGPIEAIDGTPVVDIKPVL